MPKHAHKADEHLLLTGNSIALDYANGSTHPVHSDC